MRVDVHTHTPTHRDAVPPAETREYANFRPDRPVRTTTSWAEYEQAMSTVDASIVFNIAVTDPAAATGIPTDPNRVNEATAEFVASNPTRRIGFLSVTPTAPQWRQELDRCQYELGLRGIKVGPNYQKFDPLSREAHSLYALASSRRLPIMFHQGASPITDAPLRYSHPLAMDEIATSHPSLRIVMAHMGHPWQTDTIVVIRKHPHVFADISALAYRPLSFYMCMRLAAEWNVLHKLLLGSDYPVATPGETVAGLQTLNDFANASSLPGISTDALEQIVHRDALALLGL